MSLEMSQQQQLNFIRKKKEKRWFKNNRQRLNLKKGKSKKMESLPKRTRFKSSSKIGLLLVRPKPLSNCKKMLKNTLRHGEIETKLRSLSKFMTLNSRKHSYVLVWRLSYSSWLME